MSRLAPLLLASALLLGGCPSGDGAGAPAQEVNLFIYSEYLDPALLETFQQRTGLRVNVSLFENTDEMMKKLQLAGGVRQYDVVVTTQQFVPQMVRQKLLAPLDKAQLPQLANLAPRFQSPSWDPGNTHSVPYFWGTVGLVYDAQALPELAPSWGCLFDPAAPSGAFFLLNEPRDQLGVALKYMGHSVNSTDPAQLKAAGELLLATKRRSDCLGFGEGVGNKNQVLAGQAQLAVAWNGDAARGIDEARDRLRFVVPREGSILWCDVLGVTAEAPNPRGAHQLIDFLLEAEVAAQNARFTRFASPNAKAQALLPAAERDDPVIYPPEAVMNTLESLVDLGQDNALYDEVWNSVKAR